jgi:hypothetical protein
MKNYIIYFTPKRQFSLHKKSCSRVVKDRAFPGVNIVEKGTTNGVPQIDGALQKVSEGATPQPVTLVFLT